jgi:hypothetical protein
MGAVSIFVASQRLEMIHQAFGGELCLALAGLSSKLTEMPMGKRNASPREYAELREAKSLISYLRYSDSTTPVRSDDLAWALKKLAESCRADAQDARGTLFDKIAAMLEIDLSQNHAIPLELNRRISNELVLFSVRHGAGFIPMAAAG